MSGCCGLSILAVSVAWNISVTERQDTAPGEWQRYVAIAPGEWDHGDHASQCALVPMGFPWIRNMAAHSGWCGERIRARVRVHSTARHGVRLPWSSPSPGVVARMREYPRNTGTLDASRQRATVYVHTGRADPETGLDAGPLTPCERLRRMDTGMSLTRRHQRTPRPALRVTARNTAAAAHFSLIAVRAWTRHRQPRRPACGTRAGSTVQRAHGVSVLPRGHTAAP